MAISQKNSVPSESPSQFDFTRHLQGGYHVNCLFDMESGETFAELSTRLGLVMNREKTKVVQVAQHGKTLDFLTYSFRYDKGLHGRNRRDWNRIPSKKAMQKVRDRIRELTSSRWGCLPIDSVVSRLNHFLIGWSNDFGTGYPRHSFRSLNAYVLERMERFLRQLSQRPFKPPEGTSWYHLIDKVLKEQRL